MTVPGPPIADPITMIERDIAGGTPAIRETSIWMINRHKANGLKEWQVPGSDLFQYGQAIAKPAERLKTE